jgi:uncharacterized protein YkwD
MNAKYAFPVVIALALILSACNMPPVQVPPWVGDESSGGETPETAETPEEATAEEPESSGGADEPSPEEASPPKPEAEETPEGGQGEAPPDTPGGDQPPPAEAPDSPGAPTVTPSPTNTTAPPPPPPPATITPTYTPTPTNTTAPPPTATHTPTATCTIAPSGPDYTVYDDTAAMLARINAERTARGIPALSANSLLGSAALQHTIDMALNDFVSHTGSDGSQSWDRVSAQGYSWSYVAENVAAGSAGVDGAFNQWWNSSGHRDNMLSPDVTEMGLGHVYRSGTSYGHYWTLVLARP